MSSQNIFDCNIISEVDTDEIIDYLSGNKIDLIMTKPSAEWAGFAYYYGHDLGFDDKTCGSFARMVSEFITGEKCDLKTEEYEDEERIESVLSTECEKFRELKWISEDTKVQLMFECIANLYSECAN